MFDGRGEATMRQLWEVPGSIRRRFIDNFVSRLCYQELSGIPHWSLHGPTTRSFSSLFTALFTADLIRLIRILRQSWWLFLIPSRFFSSGSVSSWKYKKKNTEKKGKKLVRVDVDVGWNRFNIGHILLPVLPCCKIWWISLLIDRLTQMIGLLLGFYGGVVEATKAAVGRDPPPIIQTHRAHVDSNSTATPTATSAAKHAPFFSCCNCQMDWLVLFINRPPAPVVWPRRSRPVRHVVAHVVAPFSTWTLHWKILK